MHFFRPCIQTLFIGALAASMSACGGSGSSGSNPPTTSSSVVAVSSAGASSIGNLSSSLSSVVVASSTSSFSSLVTASTSSTTLSSTSISSTATTTSVSNSSITAPASSVASSSTASIASSSAQSSSINSGAIVVNTAQQILTAAAQAKAGDIIYIRGGTYAFASTISLSASGTSEKKITFAAYPDDASRPLFDFSAMPENSANRGLNLSGNYWHFKGIDVYNAGDNCMHINGSNNLIEHSTFYDCADSGLQLDGGASNNTILNCDSYYNADSSLENADGFAAKLDVGTGNKFIGCRAWQNLDDGWDGYLRGADNINTTYENCWAFKNGYLKNGNLGGGDGNGFKTGGSDEKNLKHNATYKYCIAAGNSADGFDHNSNRGSVTLLSCAAHNNKSNINFSSTNIAASLVIKNTVSLGTNGGLNATQKDITNNSWQNGLQATDADFTSVDIMQLAAPRKADGSLPDISYLHLKSTSSLVDKGVDAGLPFNGTAPDIGAFESPAAQ